MDRSGLVVNWLRHVNQIHAYKEYVKIKIQQPINVYASQDLPVSDDQLNILFRTRFIQAKNAIHHLISVIIIHVSMVALVQI